MTEDFEPFDHGDEAHEAPTCPECIRQEAIDKAGHLLENASSVVGAFQSLVGEMERLETKAYEEMQERELNEGRKTRPDAASGFQTPYLTRYMRTVGLYNTLIKSISLFSPDDAQVIGYARVLEARHKSEGMMSEFMKTMQVDEDLEEPAPVKKPIDKKLN